jgi:RNA-directed DNA polymerase
MPADPLRGERAARDLRGDRSPAKGPTGIKLRSEHHRHRPSSGTSPGGSGGPPESRCKESGWEREEVLAIGQLLEEIADPANLARAWTSVRANAGAAGVDGQSIGAFGADDEHQLASLRRRLLSPERYVPPPVRRVEIPKPNGRTRPLGIPTVADRVVQQAARQVLEPIFEEVFCPSSFGYRPGKGAGRAVGAVREAIRDGGHFVAEFDIVGFFDNLRHARLLREFAKRVEDPEVIGLVRRWLRAGVLTEAGVRPTLSGTPQGGVISPLLANIYLHRLDVEAERLGLAYVRYADDFVILTRTWTQARAAEAFVRKVLADIGLEVAEEKSRVGRVRDGFEFLGFTFHGRFLRPRPRALLSFKDAVRARTRRQAPISLARMIEELNPTLRGWGYYFAQGDVISLFEDLDKWIRDRLRSKVRGAKAKRYSGALLPNRVLYGLGLVRLEDIVRHQRLLSA